MDGAGMYRDTDRRWQSRYLSVDTFDRRQTDAAGGNDQLGLSALDIAESGTENRGEG
jgi:hypothetical protein